MQIDAFETNDSSPPPPPTCRPLLLCRSSGLGRPVASPRTRGRRIVVYPRVLPFSVLLALRFSRLKSPGPPREPGGGAGRLEVSVAAGSGPPQ